MKEVSVSIRLKFKISTNLYFCSLVLYMLYTIIPRSGDKKRMKVNGEVNILVVHRHYVKKRLQVSHAIHTPNGALGFKEMIDALEQKLCIEMLKFPYFLR